MNAQDCGLRRRPFPATPDRAFYYPASTHEAALAELGRAIDDDEGLALLSGFPGMGKTLVAHCALERLGHDSISGFLTNTHFADRSALLQAILFDFSLPYEDGSEQVLRLRLTDFLLKNRGAGRRAVLLIDEAHLLTADLLEELRLLGNLESGTGKALQVILIAQDSLLETLARPELAAFQQRLAVRARLEPLGLEEAVDFLLHQVRVAGGQPEALFDDTAVETLARGGRGIPRLLNQAAHQALVLAQHADMSRVDAEAALEALARLGLEADVPEGEPEPLLSPPSIVPAPHHEDLGADDEAVCRLFDSPRRPA
jgi:general secretion pathway protein A